SIAVQLINVSLLGKMLAPDRGCGHQDIKPSSPVVKLVS
ncbi:hypothetical protein PanWU01x14_334850, partial [Parasponia andersonii]